jgi:hypothetical protein
LTDSWETGRETVGWIDRQMNGRTDSVLDIQMVCKTDRETVARIDRWMHGRTDRQTDGQLVKEIDRCMGR